MVKACKKDGGSVFLVYDSSLHNFEDSPRLDDISGKKRAWDYGDVYIISNEVKFCEYGEGAVIFFPQSFTPPSKSPLGRPTTLLPKGE